MQIFKEPGADLYVAITSYHEKDYLKDVKATWSPEDKCWYLNRKQLLSLLGSDTPGVVLDPEIEPIRAEAITLADRKVKSKALSRATESDIEVPCPEGLIVRSYQRAAVEFAQLHDGRILLADEMGTGKTIEILSWLNLRTDIRKVVVVCKAIGKKNWERETNKWLMGEKLVRFATGNDCIDWMKQSRVYLQQGGRIVFIINYEILNRYVDVIKEFAPQLIVLDEAHFCFPYNATIITDEGPQSIGDVVEHGVGHLALSHNKQTGQLEWQPIAERFKRHIGFSYEMCYNYTNTLMRITHEHGEFICTGNHKIWTASGYKEAASLSNRDVLSVLPQEVQNQKTRQDDNGILLPKLCRYSGKCANRCKKRDKQGAKEANKATDLRVLWQDLYTKKSLWCKEQIALLRQHLCRKMENGTAGQKRNLSCCNKDSTGIKCRTKAPGCCAEDEGAQSNGRPRCQGKDAAKVNWQNLLGTGWQWNTNYSAEISCGCTRSSNRIYYINASCCRTIQKFTSLLQSGYSRSNTEDSNRDRRQNTQTETLAVPRPSENRGLACSRVVSAEVLERGGYSGPTTSSTGNSQTQDLIPVYNIEVANNNNYFANGVLVSNCKNYKAQRTQAAMTICRKVQAVICATGTPIYNKVLDLWKIIHLIDPLTFPDKAWFLRRYFGYDPVTHSGNQDYKKSAPINMDDLHQKLSESCMMRRLKSAVLKDLPPKVRTIIELETDAKNRVEVRKAEKSLFKELGRELGNRAPTIAQIISCMRKPEVQGMIFSLMKKVGVAKAPAAVEFIQDLLEEMEDDKGKIVVFTRHHDVSDILTSAFPGSLLIDGRMNDQTRRFDIIDEFNNNPDRRIFIGSIEAAGDTINLQSASTVVFVEQHYSPFIMRQAEDRCHRFGQKGSVNVYVMVLDNSYDALLAQDVVAKAEAGDAVLDGIPPESADEQASLLASSLAKRFLGKQEPEEQ